MEGHPRPQLLRDASSESARPTFPAIISVLASVYNLLIAFSCAYLPDDPLYISFSISLYAWAGSVLSLLGLVGIATKKPVLVTIFSHFLSLDTFVSAISRLLILQFFTGAFYQQNMCSNQWDPTQSPKNFRHNIVTSVKYQKDYLWQVNHKKSCRVGLVAVQIVLVMLLICLTAAQGMLAVTMRRFGKGIERRREGRVVISRMRGSPRPPPAEMEKIRMGLE